MVVGANTILSIDDSKAVHAFLNSSCADSPFKLVHALSAKEGLEILRAGLSQIILILLDWEMPEQNGPEAYAEIRRISPVIPVIMVTSKNRPEDIQKMLGNGVSEYVMKPFTPDILLSKIATVLEGV